MNSQEEQWLLEEKYQGQKSEGFLADLKRLQDGEPLGYVIGYVPFLNCQIYLDSHPLIPRPETEFWVEKAITEIEEAAKTASHTLRVLDLCAGSGAIGIAVAKAIPEIHVHFAEIDKTHLPIIGKNLAANDISCTRYRVFESNLFENVTDKYDFILTNPPYIDPALDRTEPSVKNHEPGLALYGGKAGMEIISKIIEQATNYLNEAGVIYIEHEPEQTAEIAKLAKMNRFESETQLDQYQVERYTRLEKFPAGNMAK